MFGARTYPVEYTYDFAGRLSTMTTFSTFSAATETGTEPRTTRWNYHSKRGWLESKDYPGPSSGDPPAVEDAGIAGPKYEYTSGGRLKKRIWLRTNTSGPRVATVYTYGFESGAQKHGNLVEIAYENSPVTTPGVTYVYDRLGRLRTVTRDGMTTTLGYNDANQPLTEGCTGGMLGGFSVSRVYHDNLQIETLSATGIGGYSVGYAHDTAGRLGTVTENTSIATYGYVPDSMLVQQVSFTHSSSPRLTTTRGYDVLNRLESISSAGSGTLMPLRYAYRYNSANQRDRVTMGDSTHWDYTYDDLGQVTSGKRKWQVDNTAVAGQQYKYTFDEIGNRTQTKAGGDASGGNLRPAGYTPNRLNQYDSRAVPGAVDVVGLGKPDVSVTVNYNKAARKAEYFHYALPVGNSENPVYASVTVQNDGVSTSGNIFVPKATEVFGYDADGNLTNDGRWSFTWDAENRLVKMEPSGTVTAPRVRVVNWSSRMITWAGGFGRR